MASSELVAKRPAEGYASLDDLVERVLPKAVTGSRDYVAQQKRSRKKPLEHRPERPADLTGNLKSLYENNVLEPIIDEEHYARLQQEFADRLRAAIQEAS